MATSAHRSQTVLDLFERFYGRVYCFARRSVSSDIAEDTAQDVFIRLLEHKNLENMEISVSYLLKIADNLIKRRWQREQRFGRYQHRVRAEEQASPAGALEHSSVIISEEHVHEALSELPDGERAAVELIVCNDLSYEQAAESLGVRVTTVNNWKYRGLQKLKNMAEQHEPDCAARVASGGGNLAADARGVRKQESRSSALDAHHPDMLLHPEHPDYRRRSGATAGSPRDQMHRAVGYDGVPAVG